MTTKQPPYYQSSGTVYYAKLNYKKPDMGFNKNQPNMQLLLIPDDMAPFEKENIPVKEATDNVPGKHFRIKTNFVDRPLLVKDAKGNKVPHDLLIGNGSKVNVIWSPYTYKATGNISATLRGVQIVDLISYEPSVSFDTQEDGFEYTSGENVSEGDPALEDDIPF